MRNILIVSIILAMSSVANANEKLVMMNSPENLRNTEFWSYVLPRFKLKTGIKVLHSSSTEAEILVANNESFSRRRLGLMEHGETNSKFSVELNGDSEFAKKFQDWLLSEIGQRTISSYRENDKQIYFPIEVSLPVSRSEIMTGNVAFGEETAIAKCGRCHVVSERNKYGGIDSTPSFGALRTLKDWREKFEVFWTLNPHPSFTQIEEVTEPFDPARPPHIYPIYLTLTEVENIGAFMETIPPKDLGPPINPN